MHREGIQAAVQHAVAHKHKDPKLCHVLEAGVEICVDTTRTCLCSVRTDMLAPRVGQLSHS
jgi:hypothetical protein